MLLTSTMMLTIDGGLDTRLELLDSLTTPSGTQISTYRPAGRATYAEASA